MCQSTEASQQPEDTTLSSPFHRQGNSGPEGLSKLPRKTQLVTGKNPALEPRLSGSMRISLTLVNRLEKKGGQNMKKSRIVEERGSHLEQDVGLALRRSQFRSPARPEASKLKPEQTPARTTAQQSNPERSRE